MIHNKFKALYISFVYTKVLHQRWGIGIIIFLRNIALCAVIINTANCAHADEIVVNNNKKALIFGVTGRDGSYLAEFLLDKKYEVHGVIRRSSSNNTHRLNGFDQKGNFVLHYGDITDALNVVKLIKDVQPDEIYNLAAQSHVRVSFDIPCYTAFVDCIGTLYILEAIKILDVASKVKFYQASTSELFGSQKEVPQSETTQFSPCSPYAIAKLYGYWIALNYREAYNIFACNGILFNHESPRRSEDFVTRSDSR